MCEECTHDQTQSWWSSRTHATLQLQQLSCILWTDAQCSPRYKDDVNSTAFTVHQLKKSLWRAKDGKWSFQRRRAFGRETVIRFQINFVWSKLDLHGCHVAISFCQYILRGFLSAILFVQHRLYFSQRPVHWAKQIVQTENRCYTYYIRELATLIGMQFDCTNLASNHAPSTLTSSSSTRQSIVIRGGKFSPVWCVGRTLRTLSGLCGQFFVLIIIFTNNLILSQLYYKHSKSSSHHFDETACLVFDVLKRAERSLTQQIPV